MERRRMGGSQTWGTSNLICLLEEMQPSKAEGLEAVASQEKEEIASKVARSKS